MTLALRHLLPGILLLISLVIVLFDYVVTIPKLNESSREVIAHHAQDATRSIQGRLNSDFLGDPSVTFPVEIFNTAALPETKGLYIVNRVETVLFAHRSRFIGEKTTELDDRVDGILLNRAIENGGIVIDEVDSKTGIVNGYAGIARTLPTGVERLGVILVLDYSYQLEELRALSRIPSEWSIGLLTIVSLLFASGLRLYLDNRQTPLFDALKKVSQGRPVSPNRFYSGDEFSEIGMALANTSQSLKKRQDELTALRQQNLDLARSRRAVIEKVGEDFRNPITSVQGFFDLLSNKDLPDDAQRLVQEGQVAARVLRGLSGDLLDSALLADETYQPRRDTICVPVLFQTVYDLTVPNAQASRVVIRLESEIDQSEWISADEAALSAALLQMMTAILQNMEASSLLLRYGLKQVDSTSCLLSISLKGRFLEDREFLLNSSKRHGDGSESRVSLPSIVSRTTGRILQNLGAQLITTVARGDTETDTLKILLRVPSMPPVQDINSYVTGLKMRKSLELFLMEPDSSNRHLCRTLLQKEGHSVLSTKSAEEAERSLQDRLIYGSKNPPEIFIINLDLPNNSSADLLKQMRSINKQMLLVPVIGLTSRRRYASVLAEQMGVTRVVSKPFAATDLISAINYVAKLMVTAA